ncbi:MAG: hypothetical protein ACREQ2_24375 [Candidatus Binatia bacterium]
MRIRNVIEEYEAHLKPAQSTAASAGSARGKGEWKVYGNGTRQCQVRVSGLDLSDGAVIQLAVSGQQFAELVVRGGRAYYRRESEHGEAVPEVETKQVLQVSYAGQIMLEGEFYSE